MPTAYFCSPHPRNYCVAPAQVTQVYNNTTVINNYNINNRTIVNHGIAVENIAAASRTTIHPVPVHQINSSYRRMAVKASRPTVPAMFPAQTIRAIRVISVRRCGRQLRRKAIRSRSTTQASVAERFRKFSTSGQLSFAATDGAD